MARDAHRYLFRSVWRLDCSAQRAYDVLVDVSTYPTWWPQVRSVRQFDDVSGEITCRSMLPYDLTFVIHREVEDPVARILRATMVGDLSGTSQWTIESAGDGCVAVFDEDVVVRKSLVRAAGVIARPALRFNHGLMMRAGEHGLQRHVAGVGA